VEDNILTRFYLVENCYNIPNAVYIGKTSLKYGRKAQHIKKFGPQILYTYIDEINSLDKNIWKPLETYWIHQFKQWGFDVLNKNEGGGGPQFLTEESKQKMSHPRSFYPKGQDHGNFNKPKLNFPKGIYNKNYKKPKPLRTIEHNQNISQSKKGKSLPHSKSWNKNISESKKNIFTNKSKPIIITNLITNEIQIARNTKDASNITNISAKKIWSMVNKKQLCNIYKNFAFEFKN
jgi:hypothetical protein